MYYISTAMLGLTCSETFMKMRSLVLLYSISVTTLTVPIYHIIINNIYGRMRNSVIRERCDMKDDVVARIEKGMLHGSVMWKGWMLVEYRLTYFPGSVTQNEFWHPK